MTTLPTANILQTLLLAAVGPTIPVAPPPPNVSILTRGWQWLVVEHPEAFLLIVLPLVGWLATEMASHFSIRWWSFYRRLIISCFSRYHCWRRSHHLRIVTIDDYVRLLERLRAAIVVHYKYRKEKPAILIHVFTQQLPSDWPLWYSSVKPDLHGLTELERYHFDFKEFLERGKRGDSFTVEVKRVIVIDACTSPRGESRLQRLQKDVQASYFNDYIERLHVTKDDAYYYTTPRPWPGWLSDVVFYGVDVEGKRNWVWAVTTSFTTGEDFILLRLHRLTSLIGIPKLKHLPLPGGIQKLEDLADKAGNEKWGEMNKLTNLLPKPDETFSI